MSGGVERRKTPRKGVLETFQVFLVIPEKGFRKIHLKDVSQGGIGFYAEPGDNYASGQTIRCFFYINPGLKLPLVLKVAHTYDEGHPDGIRTKVGCEFAEKDSKAYRAYASFIDLLDELSAFVDP